MAFPETKADRPQTEISPSRKMLIAGITVLAFVLTCAGLNAILPLPEIDVLSPNLRFFLQHRDDFDTLFIGSSRIRHQISPAIFDRTMGAAGFPTRTFNFGVNAMVPPEDGYVLERLLGARPRHLKWVFIELDELQTKRVPETELRSAGPFLFSQQTFRDELHQYRAQNRARPVDLPSLERGGVIQ